MATLRNRPATASLRRRSSEDPWLPPRPSTAFGHRRLSEASDAAKLIGSLQPLLECFSPPASPTGSPLAASQPGSPGAHNSSRLSGLTVRQNAVLRVSDFDDAPTAASRTVQSGEEPPTVGREELVLQCDQLLSDSLRAMCVRRADESEMPQPTKQGRRRPQRTVYYCSGHEVYALPSGLTRSRAAEEVVMRRLQLLADDREEQQRLKKLTAKRRVAGDATADDIVRRNVSLVSAHSPKAVRERRSRRQKVRNHLQERAMQHRLELEDMHQRRNEFLADKQNRRREEAMQREQRQQDERTCAGWLPLIVIRTASEILWDRVREQRAEKIVRRRHHNLMQSFRGLFMAPVSRRRDANKVHALVRWRSVWIVLRWYWHYHKRYQACDRIYACLASHGGQVWYRMRQFRSNVLRCQRFVRWCADQGRLRLALLLMQFNAAEVRVLGVEPAQRQHGAHTLSAGRRNSAARSPSTYRHRASRNVQITELSFRPPALLAPRVPFNVKYEVLSQVLHLMSEAFKGTFRQWLKLDAQWQAEIRQQQVHAAAMKLLHSEGSAHNNDGNPSEMPTVSARPLRPRMPRALSAQRMLSQVERAMRMQDQVECGWQIEAERKHALVRERERESRDKARSLYAEERLREIDFLRTLDTMQPLKGTKCVPLDLVQNACLQDV